MSNGIEAMQAQRTRGKPQPMHPRQGHGGSADEPEQQADDSVQSAAAAPATGSTGEQSTQIEPEAQGTIQQRGARAGGTKGTGKSGKKASKTRQAPAVTVDPEDGGAVGKAQGKQVSDVALGWAAAARKEAERAELVRGSVEVARQAGTPGHVLLSALRAAEYRAGVQLPAEVWRAAGLADADRE